MSPIRKRRTDPIPTRTVRVRRNGVIFDVEEPTVESRFVAYFGEPTTDAPGLILNSAGDVYLVGPDGTRTQLEGGGGGGGSDIPIADQTDASSLDTTTYPNPIADDGSKLATLVFSPAETQFAMLATALDDDAFPRVLLGNDLSTGWYFGDGTVDPWDVGASLFLSSVQDQSNALTLTPFFLAGGTGDGSGNALQIGALTEFGTVDEDSYYRTLALQSDFSLFSLGTVGIWVVDGESPQGVLPALNVGDLAIQYGENPGLWQATTNGDPTQAVWAAIGGSLPEGWTGTPDGETTDVATNAGNIDVGTGAITAEDDTKDFSANRIRVQVEDSDAGSYAKLHGSEGVSAAASTDGTCFTADSGAGATAALDAGALPIINLPTSDPGIAGALWNDSGTPAISAG